MKNSLKQNSLVDWALVLECLEELKDIDYQRRVWIRGAKEEVSGLEDTLAALFDDSALESALRRSDEVLSPEVDSDFRKLSKIIESLDRDRLTGEIIETDEWAIVREISNRLLGEVKSSILG